MTRPRASTVKLEPGEHTVDRGDPTRRTINGRKVFVLDWSLRLYDGTVVRRRSSGTDESKVRQRARAKVEELLASTTSPPNTGCSATSDMRMTFPPTEGSRP